MVNDWLGNWRATAELFAAVPGLPVLVETLYGRDYCLPSERFSARDCSIDRESWPKIEKNAHVDYPEWQKRDGRGLVARTVRTAEGQTSFVLLCQSMTHSIATGGTSPGVYVSPKRGAEAGEYIAALKAQWVKNHSIAADPDAAGKKVQFWRAGTLALGPTPHHAEIIALCMAFGLPPAVYPSGKRVDSAPSYSGSYKHFAGEVCPDPATLVHNACDATVELINAANAAFSEELARAIKAPFLRVLQAFPTCRWAMRPAAIAPEHLKRCLFI
jgi:hypothetical protein